MQLEGEYRPAGGRVEDLTTGDEGGAEGLCGVAWAGAGCLGELCGDALVPAEGAWLSAYQPAFPLGNADRGFDPAGQRVGGEHVVVAGPVGSRAGDGAREACREVACAVWREGRSFQGLADHPVRVGRQFRTAGWRPRRPPHAVPGAFPHLPGLPRYRRTGAARRCMRRGPACTACATSAPWRPR